jgi:Prokaryotic phospholipase A2
MLRQVWILTLCAVLSFLVTAVDPTDTGAHTDPVLQRALDAITTATFDTANPSNALPADWERVMGYRPAVLINPIGRPILIKPTGECSSFTGQTGYGFNWVCAEHDLAYDVLRYSARTGHPTAAAARQQADDMFGRDLHNQCRYEGVTGPSAAVCHFWAESFSQTVDVNSWRQGWRPPVVHESVPRYLGTMAMFLFLVGARRRLDRLADENVLASVR